MHAITRFTLFALAAICATALSQAAIAAVVQQSQIMLSADNCQAALPAFDGNIRKRPLAMQNDGTTPAFVTCGFKGLGIDPHSAGNDLIGVALTTQGSQSVSVTCTLVNGFSEPVYLTQTRTVHPGVANLLFWTGNGLDLAAMSCSLPPQTGILYTMRNYEETIED